MTKNPVDERLGKRHESWERRCIVIAVILRECLVPGETHFARVEAREIVDELEKEGDSGSG